MNNKTREILTNVSGECEDTRKEQVVSLVVDECIKVIQLGITRDGRDTLQYQRSIKHITDIKKHFGVE